MTPSENQTDVATASDLLERRAQLQEWLTRLDDVGDDIPAQVARRVRADYEQRMAEVVAELAAHSEALAGDRDRLDEQLLAAAERHDAAVDTLEETRLRHRIGEISPEEWEGRRAGLEGEVDAAQAERASVEQEIATLEELLAQLTLPAEAEAAVVGDDEATLEAGTPAYEPAVPAEPAAVAGPDDFAEAAEEWEPQLEEEPEVEPLPELQPQQPAEEVAAADVSSFTPDLEEPRSVDDDLVEITNFAAAAEALADEVDPAPAGDDDYAFLEELDRAIAATAPTGASSEEEADAETRPQPGLKCPECGYSNDPAAWYCGVCGVDLG